MVEQQVSVVAVLKDRLSTPMGKVTTSLAGVGTALDKLQRRFSPVLNQFTALAGVVGVVAAAQRSLTQAEQSSESGARLKSALSDRVELTRELVAQTQRLQKETNLEDEALADAASTMARIGVSADQLPRALEVAAKFAVAFRVPLDAVAQALGSIDEGGAGRALQRLVPSLRGVVKEGASLGEVLDVLEQKSQGAADAVTQTVFGRIKSVELAIGDLSERIGDQLAKIKLASLQILEKVVAHLADAVDSPAFGVFVDLLAKAADHAELVAAGILAIGAAVGSIAGLSFFGGLAADLVAVGTALLPVITAVGSVVAALAPAALVVAGIVAGVAALSTGVLALTGHLGEVVDTFAQLFKWAGALFQQVSGIVSKIAAGNLTVSDLFDFVKTKLSQLGTLFQGFIVEPIKAVAQFLIDVFGGAWDVVSSVAQLAFLKVVHFLKEQGLAVARFLAGKLEAVVNGVASALAGLDKLLGTKLSFDKVDLLGKLPEQVDSIDADVERLNKRLESGANSISGAYSKVALHIGLAVSGAIASVAQQQDQLDQRLLDSEERLTRARAEVLRGQVRDEQQRLGRLADDALRARRSIEDALQFQQTLVRLSDLVDLDASDVKSALKQVAEDTRDSLRAIIEQRLDEQLRAGQLSAQQFLALRREAETGALNAQAEQQQKAADAATAAAARYAEELATVRGLVAAEEERGRVLEATPGLDAARQLEVSRQHLKDLAEHESELVGKIGDQQKVAADAEQKRSKVQVALTASAQAELAVRAQLADKVLEQAKQAGDLARDEAKRTTALLQAGAISQDEALVRTRDGALALGKTLAGARAQVQELLAGPGVRPGALAAELQAAQKTLDDLGGIQVELHLGVARDQQDSLRKQLEDSSKAIDDLVASGAVGFDRAAERVQAALDLFDHGVQQVRARVAALERQQTLTPAQVDELRLLRAELEQLDQLRVEPRLGLADAIEKQVGEAKTKLDDALHQLSQQVDAGQLTSGAATQRATSALTDFNQQVADAEEAVRALAEAQPELAGQLDEVIARLERYKEVLPKPEDTGDFFGGVHEGATKTIEDLGNLNKTGQKVGRALTSDLADGLVDVFVRGRQSFGEFLASFVAGIAIMIAKAELFAALKSAFGLGANTGGFILGPGAVAHFADGGWVPGPRVNRDVVDAKLTPGEAVMSVPVVDYYGFGFIADLMARRIPREVALALSPRRGHSLLLSSHFAAGGGVGDSGGASRQDRRPVEAAVVSNEQNMSRLLAGGGEALWTYLGDHRGRARAVLGI